MSEERIIGPYRLVQELGRGGMASVFVAEPRQGGERVALKLVAVPEAPMFQAIRREIHALSRLDHPGIVGIVAQGLHEGMPWYAMQLAEGRTLHSHLRELFGWPDDELTDGQASTDLIDHYAPTEPFVPDESTAAPPPAEPPREPERTPAAGGRLDEALGFVRSLCDPLRYMHGEGLVHRDLKPANVVIRSDRSPIIIDFGLSQPFSGQIAREQLEVAGAASGTVTYMAPEQARGELVDARADLYSLGCILYELLTGRPPFVADDAPAVLWQHLMKPPDPPSMWVDGVPSGVERLVLRLLAKDPRERPGYADDVARDLAGLGAASAAAEAFPVRTYLYRPGLAGRGRILSRLDDVLDRVVSRKGEVVLLEGESGVGKTRLLMELSSHAVQRRLQVVAGHCSRHHVEPLSGFRGILQSVGDRCREVGASETQRLLGRRALLLAEFEPGLSSLPGIDPTPLPRLTGQAAELRVSSFVVETLVALADRNPTVVLLDDIQWADDLALAVLAQLGRVLATREVGLLVAVTYRSSEATARLSELVTGLGVEKWELGRLADADVACMVRDMLALDRVPEGLADYLARQSQGNPLFVAEYLRAAVERGLLLRTDGRFELGDLRTREEIAARLPLPGTVRDLVRERLTVLGEEARCILEAAAVVGRQGREDLVRGVSGLSDEQAMEALQELVARQVLEATGAWIRFAHGHLAEVAYEELPEDRRAELHRRVASRLDAEPTEQRRTQLGELGHHWEGAGDLSRARDCYLEAARAAVARAAPGEAERLYRSALRLTEPNGEQGIEMRLELVGRVLQLRGRHEEALGELADLRVAARSIGLDRLEPAILRSTGRSLRVTGSPRDAQIHFDAALVWSRRLGDGAMTAMVMDDLGTLLAEQRRRTEAEGAYRRALTVYRELGDRRAEGVVLGNLASLRHDGGELEAALELHEEALHIHREAQDRRNEAIRLGNMAVTHQTLGRVPEALDLYQMAVVITRQAGDRRAEAVFGMNLGLLHREVGRWAQARSALDDALRIFRQIGDRGFEGLTLANLADVERQAGEIDLAEAMFDDALALLRESGQRLMEGRVMGDLARLHSERGRIDRARKMCEEALALAREVGDRRSEGIWLADLVTYRRWMNDDIDEAAKMAGEAVRILREIGELSECGIAWCAAGHLQLARGRNPDEELREARSLAEAAQVTPESELAIAVARLGSAADARGRGEPLLRGELAEAMPPALRRRLEEGTPPAR